MRAGSRCYTPKTAEAPPGGIQRKDGVIGVVPEPGWVAYLITGSGRR